MYGTIQRFLFQEVIMDYFSIFIQMLQARNLADNTIRSYSTYMRPYLQYLSDLHFQPETVPWQVVRDFLAWIQKERNLSDRTVNMIISHLQFFWIYVIHQPWDPSQVPFRKFRTFLPFVPDRKQVSVFLSSLADNPKAQLAVSILYATGMRLDELCHLECKNIIHSSGKIYIPVTKNYQDRYVPLPESIYQEILNYWYSFPAGHRPKTWLFTQQLSLEAPMDKQWLQNVILNKRKQLQMDERLTAHSFRHAYATHSYENGMDLLTLKTFLGHRSINSTAIYIHLAQTSRNTVVNPYDQIGGFSHA